MKIITSVADLPIGGGSTVLNFQYSIVSTLENSVRQRQDCKDQPKVSIVIPFFNCPFVDQAITSALDQSYPNIEVIVVNDGSTKHSDKIIPYLNKIRYIEKGNGGTASALNMGIRNATGEYFTWLSADDRYDRNKVAKQLLFMQKRQADVSYTSYLLINSEGNVISESAGIGADNKLQFCEYMRKGCIINGCTVMVRTAVLSDIGLFDETLPYAHDYDLWLRMMKKHEFHYLNETLVYYRVHEQMGSNVHAEKIPREISFVQQKHRSALDEIMRGLQQ